MTDPDDQRVASVFAALGDTMSLRLLLQVLSSGGYSSTPLNELRSAPLPDLARLVAVGLLEPTQLGDGVQGYRVTNAEAVERLLATARRLAAGERGP